MKKYLTVIIAISTLLVSSCADFLNIRTEASMPTSGMDYTKVENVFQPVSAAYASMRLSEGRAFNYISVMGVPSDDDDKGSTETDGIETKELDLFTYGPTNGHIDAMWVHFYDIVSAANYAIESMPKFAENFSDATALATVAACGREAKVIRAYAYFNLVRMFGAVPKIDRTMTAQELGNLAPTSVEGMYDFIYQDLDEAIEVLPESFAEKGRYNRYTAMALKSKVALYRKDWNEAAANADAVIASGKFALEPEFLNAFSIDGEYGKESLMEIGSDDLGQVSGSAPLCYYGFIQGPRSNQPSSMQGWGFKVPSQKLVDFLTERGDMERLAVTVLKRGENTPYGDLILETCPNPYYNGKVCTPSATNTFTNNSYGLDHNMRLIRYAEVLLIYAEALVEGAVIESASGMSADAALNMVRERAGLSAIGATRESIWEERRAELAMEDDRFFDLVRTGQAAAVLASKGFKAGVNEVFPTPSNQIQINTGLVKTPGYTY